MTSNIRGNVLNGKSDDSRTETIHGVLVTISGTGVLITGEPGVGKSKFALELVSQGHALVADDVVVVKRWNHRLIGCGPARFAGILAVRGYGIVDVRELLDRSSYCESAFVDFCIELRDDDGASAYTEHTRSSEFKVLGVSIPKLIVRTGRSRSLPFPFELVRSLFDDETVAERLFSEHDRLIARAPV